MVIDAPLLADAPVAVYAVDLSGRVSFWNRAAEELFGWSADEVLGQPPPMIDDGDREQALEGMRRILAGEVFVDKPFSPLHKDGHRVTVVHATTLLRDEAGAPAAVLIVSNDVGADIAAESELEREERKWRELVSRVADTVTIAAPDGTVVLSTGELGDGAFGYPAGWWKGRSGFELLHPDELERAGEAWGELVAAPGAHVREVFRTRHADGHYQLVEFSGINLTDDPAVAGIAVTTRNVSALERAEALLADEARILELIAEDRALPDVLEEIVAFVEYHTGGVSGLFLVDEFSGYIGTGAVGSMPDELVELIEQTPIAAPGADAEALGFPLREPVVVTDVTTDPRTIGIAEQHTALGIRAGWSYPIIEQRNGALYGILGVWYPDPRPPSDHERTVVELASHLAVAAVERDSWQRDLFQQARFDALTGLPNRTLVLETLDDTLRRARARAEAVAVILVDVDRFKLVNDSRGHQTGDRLLADLARRLRDVVRAEAFVGHLGADEFVIVLGPGTSLPEAELVADTVQVAIGQPFALDDDIVLLTASMGIAVSAAGLETTEGLLQQADGALYRAKQRGRDRRVVFDEQLRSRTIERIQLDRELRLALERQELELHYQPEVDAHTGRIVGAEALLRWRHPERGLVAPDTFIGIAEDSGQIVPIGNWVLEEAVRQARAWSDTIPGLDDFTLSINLSARQLHNRGLTDTVAFVLTRYGWPPSRLTLELTESILIDDRDETLFVLGRLRLLGVRLAIDDFGTGFASLDYLHKLTVDQVKIDRSFVTPLQPDGQGSPVAAAIMHLVDAFGLTVVAEGVETPEQHAGLQAIGCRIVQGYLFSRPVPPTEFASLLAADRAATADGAVDGGPAGPRRGRRRSAPPAWPS